MSSDICCGVLLLVSSRASLLPERGASGRSLSRCQRGCKARVLEPVAIDWNRRIDISGIFYNRTNLLARFGRDESAEELVYSGLLRGDIGTAPRRIHYKLVVHGVDFPRTDNVPALTFSAWTRRGVVPVATVRQCETKYHSIRGPLVGGVVGSGTVCRAPPLVAEGNERLVAVIAYNVKQVVRGERLKELVEVPEYCPVCEET